MLFVNSSLIKANNSSLTTISTMFLVLSPVLESDLTFNVYIIIMACYAYISSDELCLHMLPFISTMWCFVTKLQGEEQWLKTLERESLPTVAQDIRVCVAEAVGKLWRVMETLPDAAKRYWSLVVLLLQDVDECVRNAIAKSLIFLLAGMFPQSKFLLTTDQLWLMAVKLILSYR